MSPRPLNRLARATLTLAVAATACVAFAAQATAQQRAADPRPTEPVAAEANAAAQPAEARDPDAHGTAPAGPGEPQPDEPAEPRARTMIWDRVRVRAALARQRAGVERELAGLRQTLGEQHPRVAQARQRMEAYDQELRALDDYRPGLAAGAPVEVVLEKAAYLGVTTSQATPVLRAHLKLPEGVGLVVDFVEPGSPADVAGLRPFDVLVRFDQQILINPQQLAVLVRTLDAGAEVPFRIVRAGEETAVAVRLVEREVKPLGRITFGGGGGGGGGGGAGGGGEAVVDFQPRAPAPANAQPAVRDRPVAVGDLLVVTVSDLQGPGLDTVKSARVSPDGTLRLPYLETPVRATGLTEVQLQRAIQGAYRKEDVLENASVSVSVTARAAAPRRPKAAVPPPPPAGAEPQPTPPTPVIRQER